MRIFADTMSKRFFRNAVRDLLPRFSVIIGLENIGMPVIPFIPMRCEIASAGIVMRRLYDGNDSPLRQSGWRDILPMFSFVGRDMHKSVIRAGPENALFNGGRCESKN